MKEAKDLIKTLEDTLEAFQELLEAIKIQRDILNDMRNHIANQNTRIIEELRKYEQTI